MANAGCKSYQMMGLAHGMRRLRGNLHSASPSGREARSYSCCTDKFNARHRDINICLFFEIKEAVTVDLPDARTLAVASGCPANDFKSELKGKGETKGIVRRES